ncbi:MAG: hypothetical protein NZ703_11285, partial [Gemmataceae bacterium]|nr:hypothetical protein [Gemmataceae bacterium]
SNKKKAISALTPLLVVPKKRLPWMTGGRGVPTALGSPAAIACTPGRSYKGIVRSKLWTQSEMGSWFTTARR